MQSVPAEGPTSSVPIRKKARSSAPPPSSTAPSTPPSDPLAGQIWQWRTDNDAINKWSDYDELTNSLINSLVLEESSFDNDDHMSADSVTTSIGAWKYVRTGILGCHERERK